MFPCGTSDGAAIAKTPLALWLLSKAKPNLGNPDISVMKRQSKTLRCIEKKAGFASH